MQSVRDCFTAYIIEIRRTMDAKHRAAPVTRSGVYLGCEIFRCTYADLVWMVNYNDPISGSQTWMK